MITRNGHIIGKHVLVPATVRQLAPVAASVFIDTTEIHIRA